MRILYLDCGMGAAGDMLTAALLELFPDREAVVSELNAMGIPGVRFEMEPAVKCGITGTHMHVFINGEEEAAFHHHHHHGHTHEHDHHHEHDHVHDHDHVHEHDHDHHDHHHHHSGMDEIRHLIRHLSVPSAVREKIEAVYLAIAQAESHVHGESVEHIHFHEVGSMDAVADVAAVCYLLHKLEAERIVASAVHVGSGQVHCAHGILPVPAPATAYILRDVPIYGGEIRGELCTPTGAALLKTFVSDFGAMPVMKTEAIGYGMGSKDFPAANCVRAILGSSGESGDTVMELSCNLDDMTGEAIGFAMEQLLRLGALDVFTVPVGMKKSRPGVMLTVLCRENDRERMVAALFGLTSTLGIREQQIRRHTLSRSVETVSTPYGEVRRKAVRGYGVERSKYEYEDLAALAREQGCSIEEIRAQLP